MSSHDEKGKAKKTVDVGLAVLSFCQIQSENFMLRELSCLLPKICFALSNGVSIVNLK